MQITFLGSGSSFVTAAENFHSNVLITSTGDIDGTLQTKHLLIDAGFHLSEILSYYNMAATDIYAVFLTHNHGDHNGGLEYLGYKTYFDPNAPKPMLYGNTRVLKTLWDDVLKGNMGSINGMSSPKLLDYFDVRYLKPRSGFQFLNTEFFPVRLPHVIDEDEEIPAFGLTWKTDGINLFYSGDVQFDFWRLMPFWEHADIIFQECEFLEYENSPHCQFNQLNEIPTIYKSKMWLYHYGLNGKTYEELESQILRSGFAGLIKRGQLFDTKKLQLEKQ